MQELDSPLQLKSLRLVQVELRVNEDYDKSSADKGFTLGFGLEMSSVEGDEHAHRLSMLVELEKKDDGQSPYSGSIQAEGVFSVADASEESMDLVRYNGSSQLYGFIRAELYDLTLKFPHAPVLLPSVNLVPLVETLDEDADGGWE